MCKIHAYAWIPGERGPRYRAAVLNIGLGELFLLGALVALFVLPLVVLVVWVVLRGRKKPE